MKKILSIKDSIISIKGEKGHAINQMVIFDKKTPGIILKTTEKVSYVIVDDSNTISISSSYVIKNKPWSVKFSNKYYGSIVDVFQNEIYRADEFNLKPEKDAYSEKPIDSKAPMFSERVRLDSSLETGLFAIDALIPIGRGQRELIIGDRKTGKTSIALSTIINQKDKGVKVIYVSIGQKQTTLRDTFNCLRENDALEYTTIIAATPELKLSQYVAPYIGMALAECLQEKGQDVLIVFDDLSKHANIIRELSLNLDKSGGREAYPSDLFYLHSKLLERSGRFNKELGGGSITALPIVETIEGDFNTILSTNVISITDGQIITDSQLARENIFPAINVGMSVSRTGSGVQQPIIKSIAKEVSKIYAQYIESKKYELISIEISEGVKKQIKKGSTLADSFIQLGYKGMDNKNMFVSSLLIEWEITNNINIRIQELIDLIEKDETGCKLLEKLNYRDKKSVEMFKIYCQSIAGIDNKYNAKRFLLEAKYE